MNRLLPLLALPMLGCHQTCGMWAPIWVQADCAIVAIAEPPMPDPGDSGDPDTADPECDVVLELWVDDLRATTVSAGDSVTLVATASNPTSAAVSLPLLDPCPDGIAIFDGLGDGYDPYGSCSAGDCATSGDPLDVVVEPGELVELARVEIDTGGDTCNEPLALGRYSVQLDLPLTTGELPTICWAPPVAITIE